MMRSHLAAQELWHAALDAAVTLTRVAEPGRDPELQDLVRWAATALTLAAHRFSPQFTLELGPEHVTLLNDEKVRYP